MRREVPPETSEETGIGPIPVEWGLENEEVHTKVGT